MPTQNLIPIEKICSHYKIEYSFFNALVEVGLVEVKIYEENTYIYQDKIGDIEKIIRLNTELNVNIEGIDIILNLLKKEVRLQEEVTTLQNRLRLYENN
ncbi:chaperone modulator CbpM [Tenacibaculum piscium]|uniref:chaperone modulator CbpM n=1 Tax=Tenacibaculum piscium TaxID=1458515 RepID=UPI001F16CEAB|nr:chaperone modulator CbpM [Tenacibaculum piscium]MCG8183068.1 MerR family transcriptional regulator [Tenacibaculum piscium]MCG8204748.1 MerR family transcriptional regulator [Tenacibaculum piscium]